MSLSKDGIPTGGLIIPPELNLYKILEEVQALKDRVVILERWKSEHISDTEGSWD